MNKILFIGPPGCGKGTQAAILKTIGYIHISSGDILRAEINSDSELGKTVSKYVSSGGLVPDEIMTEVILKKLDVDKFVLDGFPRTYNQAMMLNKHIDFDLVIEFRADDNTIKNRILNRHVCPKCNASSNHQGLCLNDNTEMIRRVDDDETTLLRRLKLYNENIAGLRDAYGDIMVIDATLSANDISKIIVNKINLIER